MGLLLNYSDLFNVAIQLRIFPIIKLMFVSLLVTLWLEMSFTGKKEGKLNMAGLFIDCIDIQFYRLLLQLFPLNNLISTGTSLFVELASIIAQQQMSIQSLLFQAHHLTKGTSMC